MASGRFLIIVIVALLTAAGPAFADDAGSDTPLQARTKALLGSFGSATTREAQTALREQLIAKADTLEAAGDDVLASHCLERAGIVSYRFAEYDAAISTWTRGLEVARRSGDTKRVAALLNARAVGVSATGDDDGAVALQLELIELRRELGDVRGEGISWHNLAYSYFALFRFPEAIDALDHALHLHREAGNDFGVAGSMGTLANALFEVGRTRDAMAMADSAVARARALGDPSVLGAALQGRARQLHYAGRLNESLNDFEEAHDVLIGGGVALVAAVSDVNRANALVSMERFDDARAVVDSALATLTSVGSTPAVVWGECVSARIDARRSGDDDARAALLATIDRLEATRDSIPNEISRADAFRMAGGAYTELALLDVAQDQPAAAWNTIEAGTARLLRAELGVSAAEDEMLPRLQSVLGRIGAVALQFGFATADRNVLCVISPDGVTAGAVVIPPGFRSDVDGALRLMSSGARDEECAPVLERIAAVLLEPVAARLDGVERIIVCPGDLSGLPFEALPLPGADAVALGDRVAITYAPSAAAFVHLQQRESGDGDVVVFADPTLGDALPDGPQLAMRTARTSLPPLPAARAAGKAIGRSGTLFVGEDATRRMFLERAPGAAVLHVAAHAVIDGAHPDYSAIVMAGDGGDMLTVAQLRDVTLTADLVTLSGCETAGGYTATGEGALGLTRAFLTAGARSVVSSWWNVEDGAARRFMELYYEALRDGAARDLAMKRARTTMANEGYPHRDRHAFALAGATADPVSALAGGGLKRLPGVQTSSFVAVLVVIIAITARRRRARRERRAS